MAYLTKAKNTGEDKRMAVKCVLFVLVGDFLSGFEWYECSGGDCNDDSLSLKMWKQFFYCKWVNLSKL